jgi:hypothetical protein
MSMYSDADDDDDDDDDDDEESCDSGLLDDHDGTSARIGLTDEEMDARADRAHLASLCGRTPSYFVAPDAATLDSVVEVVSLEVDPALEVDAYWNLDQLDLTRARIIAMVGTRHPFVTYQVHAAFFRAAQACDSAQERVFEWLPVTNCISWRFTPRFPTDEKRVWLPMEQVRAGLLEPMGTVRYRGTVDAAPWYRRVTDTGVLLVPYRGHWEWTEEDEEDQGTSLACMVMHGDIPAPSRLP